MSRNAVKCTVKSLQFIYAVVIALAIGEAFAQFALPPGSQRPGVQWDRLPSLCSLLLLVVPFYHGMSRHFCERYAAGAIGCYYGVWLLVDCLAFTVEAALFFVLARSLPRELWFQFNLAVILLLFWDILWGAFVWRLRTEEISFWVIVNLCTIPFLAAVVLRFRTSTSQWRVVLAFLIVLARTLADYRTGWEFYFPKVAAEGAKTSEPAA